MDRLASRPYVRAIKRFGRAAFIVLTVWLVLPIPWVVLFGPLYVEGVATPIQGTIGFLIGLALAWWDLRITAGKPVRGQVSLPRLAFGTAKPETATKVCPDCAETVMAAARVCRFCRYEFTADGIQEEPVGYPEVATVPGSALVPRPAPRSTRSAPFLGAIALLVAGVLAVSYVFFRPQLVRTAEAAATPTPAPTPCIAWWPWTDSHGKTRNKELVCGQDFVPPGPTWCYEEVLQGSPRQYYADPEPPFEYVDYFMKQLRASRRGYEGTCPDLE
jgi:hypothetical protein